jgi:phage terminase large subunit-like protein
MAADWMESNLVHADGDKAGQPYRLRHAGRVLYRLHEYDPKTGIYLHDKALIGWPKGSAKTEFAAALALEHLCGPTHPRGADIPVAAVTERQACELVRVAGLMVRDQPVAELLEVNRTSIHRLDGDGRMYAVSAALGANDGGKPSLVLCDEIHEWDRHSDAGAERHGIVTRGLLKRADGRQVNITTAGCNLETLAGAMYTYGCQVAAGEVDDPGFLFVWHQASDHWDLDDETQLLAAIREANPVADLFWPARRLVRAYREHKLRGEADKFCRYHLNRWMPFLQSMWMDMAAWNDRAVDRSPPPAGTQVVLGFDGSLRQDSTALVGVTVARVPHVFVVGHWPRPAGVADWTVPVSEVKGMIRAACAIWDVTEVAADPAYWRSELEDLATNHAVPVVEFSQTPARMGPACIRFLEATLSGALTHDGDPRLTRSMANCRKAQTDWGVRIVKEHEHSKRRIDLSVAAIEALERAAHLAFAGDEDDAGEVTVTLI